MAYTSKCFHEDVFYEYFRPFRHPEAHFDIWGGHGLETFGDDLRIVQKHDALNVWTVVDGDADQWIVPGLQYVNRVCYLLTEVPHYEAEVSFRVARSLRPISKLGLRRRIATLHRVLAVRE